MEGRRQEVLPACKGHVKEVQGPVRITAAQGLQLRGRCVRQVWVRCPSGYGHGQGMGCLLQEALQGGGRGVPVSGRLHPQDRHHQQQARRGDGREDNLHLQGLQGQGQTEADGAGKRGVHQEVPPACAPLRLHQDPPLWDLCLGEQEDQACRVHGDDKNQGQGSQKGDHGGNRIEALQGQPVGLS